MDLTVIMPIRKKEKQLSQAIKSLLEQDFGGSWELILIDDRPTDVPLDSLPDSSYASQIRILKTHGGKDLPAALNLGLSEARGTYICRMEADAVMAPSLLRKTFWQHERWGESVAFVSPQRYWLSYSGKPYCKLSDEVVLSLKEDRDDLILGRHRFTDAGSLFRRDRALKAGGYSAYASVAADTDLWIRLMELTGQPCITLGELLIGKRLSPSSGSFQQNARQYGQLVRAYAQQRVDMGWPADHAPSPEWLSHAMENVLLKETSDRRVYMPIDLAMINLWLKDYRGFLAFLQMAFQRNPVKTTKILTRHGIFGWYHDFIEGDKVIMNT
jgi:hypothetical protein